MGKPTGFMEIARKTDSELDPIERLKNWKEFKIHGDDKERRAQGARCMDCGTPFATPDTSSPAWRAAAPSTTSSRVE